MINILYANIAVDSTVIIKLISFTTISESTLRMKRIALTRRKKYSNVSYIDREKITLKKFCLRKGLLLWMTTIPNDIIREMSANKATNEFVITR